MTPASPRSLVPNDVFESLPKTLRSELLATFRKIVQNFAEGRWEPSELNGGKLCEIVYSILKGQIDGSFPNRAKKPSNIVDACRAIEKTPGISRSLKVQMPRMILALYDVRNNRNVGHVGGEVDPSHMDAVCVLQMSKWLIAELVRVLHDCPVDEAASVVEALSERETPLVWKVGGRTRVLNPALNMKQKMLLVLHSSAEPMAERDLADSVEHSNASVFRRDVLRPAHKARLLEYDGAAKIVTISPTGVTEAEQLIRAHVLSAA